MKALVLSAVVAACTAVPAGHAFGLPTQIAFNAFLADGPDLSDATDVGVLLFDLDADTGKTCRYYMEWLNENDVPLSLDCFVEEAKTHGSASCVADASAAVDTVIARDPLFSCSGWASNGQVSPMFQFVLGESADTADLNGVVLFSPADPFLYGFGATPYL
jgi:hypothetical protein